MEIEIKVKKLSEKVGKEFPFPFYATSGSAGLDLCACLEREVAIPPGQRAKIPTGIAIQLPHPGVAALVFPRSGNAWKYGISLTNGVGLIDSDYTGEIQVLLQNLDTDKPFVVRNGDRIAQLVIVPVYRAKLSLVDELEETERGPGGFGSTGLRPEERRP